jgi:hypothetical protein
MMVSDALGYIVTRLESQKIVGIQNLISMILGLRPPCLCTLVDRNFWKFSN